MAISFPRGKTGHKIVGLILLAWLGLVFYRAFAGRPFLDFSFLSGLLSDFHSMDTDKLWMNGLGFAEACLLATAVGLTLWRVGGVLGSWSRFPGENLALQWGFRMALGILFFNGLWLGLGLNGLWYPELLFPLALAFLAFALWDLDWATLRIPKTPKPQGPNTWALGLGVLGLLALGLSLLQAFTPVVYYDALVYHLSTLQFWMDRHGIADFSTNLYSYYPFGGELYFLNGFFFQGSETVKLLNALAAVLLGVTAAGWVAEEKGTPFGWMTWGTVLVFPLVSTIVWSAQNDLLEAFFLVLFFRALWKWAEAKKEVQSAWVPGLWAGAALSVKITAALGILAGVLALVWVRRETFTRKRLGGWGLLLSIAGLTWLPWFLKNEAYTGNGFYPYLSQWMGGLSLPLENLRQLMVDHQAVDWGIESPGAWAWRVLTRDLDVTIAPLLFGFLPFLFLPAERKPLTRYLLWLGGIFLLGGFLVSHQLRLMVPAFVVCFMGMGFVLAELKEKEPAFRVWAGVVLLFGFWSLLSLWQKSISYNDMGKAWLGVETRLEYLERSRQTASYFDLTRAASSQLTASDRLLVVGDARSLYYPRPLFANSVFDRPLLAGLARQEKNGEGIWRGLKKAGVDALAVSGEEGIRTSRQYGGYALSAEEWAKLDDFIQSRTDLLYFSRTNGIYRLRSAPTERKSPLPNLLSLFREGPSGT